MGHESTTRRTVFVSYCHRDKAYLDRLHVHLTPLVRGGTVELWDDTRIQVGDKWRIEIAEAIRLARIAILLISADFLASRFIADNELPPLLESASKHGLVVVPVILKPCGFTRTPELAEYQAVNVPDQPLVNMTEGQQEQVWDQVASIVDRLADSQARISVPSREKQGPETRQEIFDLVKELSGSDDIADLITEAMDKVGRNGLIMLKSSALPESTLYLTEGYQFDEGYISGDFINEPDRGSVVLDNPLLALYDRPVVTERDLYSVFNLLRDQKRPIVIVASEILPVAVDYLRQKLAAGLDCVAIQWPSYRTDQQDLFDDLPVYLGSSRLIGNDGNESPTVWDCRRVVVYKSNTIVRGRNTNYAAVEPHIDMLKETLNRTSNEYERERLQRRIAYMAGGIAEILAGGETHREMDVNLNRLSLSLEGVISWITTGIRPTAEHI